MQASHVITIYLLMFKTVECCL